MTGLIAYIAHPPQVLASSNAQHRKLLAAVRKRDAQRAVRAMADHLKGTEHVLAGLLRAAERGRPQFARPVLTSDPRTRVLSRAKGTGRSNLFSSRGLSR